MSVVINTNTAASIAANNLASANDMLRRSLNRLSSGSKIVNASDDAGGVAVAARLSAGSRRAAAANAGIGNAISFLQNQDSVLKELSKIVTRMNELQTLNQDATAGDDDKALYGLEYNNLAATYTDIVTNKAYNGKKLLDGTTMLIKVDDADGVYALGGATAGDDGTYSGGQHLATDAVAADGIGGDTADDTKALLDTISEFRAQNGADQSSLGYYAALGQATVSNYDAAVSRIMDVDVAAESTQLARWTTLVQAGTAMLAQANGSTTSAITLLKG